MELPAFGLSKRHTRPLSTQKYLAIHAGDKKLAHVNLQHPQHYDKVISKDELNNTQS